MGRRGWRRIVPVLFGGSAPYADRVIALAGDSLIQRWAFEETSGKVAYGQIQTAGNLCDNGDFESAFTFPYLWSTDVSDGAIDDETTLVHAGAHAVKITAGATRDTRLRQNVWVKPGETMTLTFWTRGDGTYQGRYYVQDLISAALIVAVTSTGVTGTTYQQVTKTFTIPANCTRILLGFYCPATAGGIFYLDDIALTSTDALFGRFVGTGITLNQPGFSSSTKSIYIDGANGSCVDLYSAPMRALLKTLVTGTELIWYKIDAATKADGTTDYLIRFKSSATAPLSAAVISKVNDTIDWQYIDTTVNDTHTVDAGLVDTWHCAAQSWEAGGNAIRYLDGVPVDSTPTGTWDNTFLVDQIVVGASNNVGSGSVAKGFLASPMLFDEALSAEVIAKLSRP